jgi:hypothetical protein
MLAQVCFGDAQEIQPQQKKEDRAVNRPHGHTPTSLMVGLRDEIATLHDEPESEASDDTDDVDFEL